MINIIVFGNVPLATWVIVQIKNSNYINLLGVVCDEYDFNFFKHHNMNEISSYAYCKNEKIRCLKFDEALKIAQHEDVLGISVRYNKIFKEEYFNVFNPGIINLHGGELPRYRGSNIANYAILEKAKRGAGTMHFIAKGIDEGDIVKRSYFSVADNETAHSFFIKTLNALKKTFLDFLIDIDRKKYNNTIKTISQKDLISNGETSKVYYRKGIEKYREINFNEKLDWEEINLKLRAFYFPGHSGIFLVNNKERVELKYCDSDYKS